jgi:chorismate lyase / 3-hydroxybenzoate synthase
VKNIRYLVTEANRAAGAELFAPEELKYKVYLRRPRDLGVVAGELSHSLAPATRVLCLHADVCRAELLVEIEAAGLGDQLGKH